LAKVIRFGQNQILASSKTSDLLRLWRNVIRRYIFELLWNRGAIKAKKGTLQQEGNAANLLWSSLHSILCKKIALARK